MLNICHELLACSYTNDHKRLQIVRISQPSASYFERTVFPGQTINFSAPAAALLEIYDADLTSTLRVDTIPCVELSKFLKPVEDFVGSKRSRQASRRSDKFLQSVG
jgi:hypothetical protein